MAKTLEKGSLFEHLDADGDGVITDDEMARAKEIAEFEHKRAMQNNEDAKEDQIRRMAWFALWGMLLYPVGIFCADMVGYETTGQLLADIAPTYFVAISALVGAFFGAQAYQKTKKNGTS